MTFDLVAFSESAARNGMAGITPAAGEQYYDFSGDDLYIDEDRECFLACAVTEAIANLAEWRFHAKGDPNWNRSKGHMKDQTGAVDLHLLAYLNQMFPKGSTINVEADNGNNAQLDTVLMFLAKRGQVPAVCGPVPHAGMLPPNTDLVQIVGATTVTADTWSNCPLTFTNYTFNRDSMYEILGMMLHGETMHAGRLRFKKGSPNVDDHPGVPGGDTKLLNHMFYGPFGRFKGSNPPDLEALCSAGDTAQEGTLLIRKVS